MKTIVFKWMTDGFGTGDEMRVIESTHPWFVKGSRFDYGFFNIATGQGYTIISLPQEAQS